MGTHLVGCSTLYLCTVLGDPVVFHQYKIETESELPHHKYHAPS